MGNRNIQFRTTVLENNSRFHSVYFEPKNQSEIINYFLIEYSNSSSVNNLLLDLESAKSIQPENPKYIGRNEAHIYCDSIKARFDVQLISSQEPIELELDFAIYLFNRYKNYLEDYENYRIPGLTPIDKLSRVDWDYVSGWESTGELEPKHVVKWAYLDNGYFLEQDEDLLFYKPSLIEVMHDLMLDKYSKRKTDLFKTLKGYVLYVYQRKHDLTAKEEFLKLNEIDSDDLMHLELISLIEKLEKDDNTVFHE